MTAFIHPQYSTQSQLLTYFKYFKYSRSSPQSSFSVKTPWKGSFFHSEHTNSSFSSNGTHKVPTACSAQRGVQSSSCPSWGSSRLTEEPRSHHTQLQRLQEQDAEV